MTANRGLSSLSQPINAGPTKPPAVPIELMKARPPAAPTPARKRVGMVQKMARADVTPISASVSPAKANGSEPVNSTDMTSPTAARKQVMTRLPIFRPVRSTCQAQASMAADAKMYGIAAIMLTAKFEN